MRLWQNQTKAPLDTSNRIHVFILCNPLLDPEHENPPEYVTGRFAIRNMTVS